MLSGVLLHEIEASRPVDLSGHRLAGGQRRCQDVNDALAFVDHVDDVDAVQCAEVVRLAAGRRIECGFVEIDARVVRRLARRRSRVNSPRYASV